MAPGVGIVRIAYQAAGGPADTSELVACHIESPCDDYVPLTVGNWWKWRWIEGEDEFGFRTESYREIVARRDKVFVAMQYWFCYLRRNRR
jgi:hypothetical protein